jgi:hypothetical protein
MPSLRLEETRQALVPLMLHRRETFLLPEHKSYAKFARLTAQEDKHGLLDEPSGIGTREGWARRLAERGFALKGHRLVGPAIITVSN